MRMPVLDTDAIVIGTLTTLPPATARPVLDRLTAADFPRWPAHTAYALLRCMDEAELPSLDIATLVGYARHTAALRTHQWAAMTRFLTDAASATVPATVLDFHVRLLMEDTYRRRCATAAARLAQAADNPATTTADLDHHRAAITADLDHHRTRLTTTSPAPIALFNGQAA
jgi:replicative DNA helicase